MQRFPGLGSDFLEKAPLSVKGQALFEEVARVAGSADAQVRQLVEGDYLLLYMVEGQSIYLLSIKHHRQLSFDFPAHWP